MADFDWLKEIELIGELGYESLLLTSKGLILSPAYKYEDNIPHINIMPSNHHNLLSVNFIYYYFLYRVH